MKLKKLAAGACALALGASMMAMPASAGWWVNQSDTFNQDIKLSGKTDTVYAYEVEWGDAVSASYTRTWNPDTLSYNYSGTPWTSLHPSVTIRNASNAAIQYDVSSVGVHSGMTVTVASDSTATGTLASAALSGTLQTTTVSFDIAGSPTLGDEKEEITVGTLLAKVTLGS